MTNEEIDSLVTRRLVAFHEAPIRRGQIEPAAVELPRSLIVAGRGEIVSNVGLFIETDRTSAGR